LAGKYLDKYACERQKKQNIEIGA